MVWTSLTKMFNFPFIHLSVNTTEGESTQMVSHMYSGSIHMERHLPCNQEKWVKTYIKARLERTCSPVATLSIFVEENKQWMRILWMNEDSIISLAMYCDNIISWGCLVIPTSKPSPEVGNLRLTSHCTVTINLFIHLLCVINTCTYINLSCPNYM